MSVETLLDWERVEADRYDWLYARGYPPGGPGAPLRWAYAVTGGEVFHDRASRILDVGCGRGVIAGRWKHYVGCDVSAAALAIAAQRAPGKRFVLTGIMGAAQVFADAEFDGVVCFDVLEHLPFEEIDDALAALARIPASQFLLSISCRPSAFKDRNGNGLHQCLLLAEAWLDKLREHFAIIDEKKDRHSVFVLCGPRGRLDET